MEMTRKKSYAPILCRVCFLCVPQETPCYSHQISFSQPTLLRVRGKAGLVRASLEEVRIETQDPLSALLQLWSCYL